MDDYLLVIYKIINEDRKYNLIFFKHDRCWRGGWCEDLLTEVGEFQICFMVPFFPLLFNSFFF